MEYLLVLRMTLAKDLLVQQKLTITQKSQSR